MLDKKERKKKNTPDWPCPCEAEGEYFKI